MDVRVVGKFFHHVAPERGGLRALMKIQHRLVQLHRGLGRGLLLVLFRRAGNAELLLRFPFVGIDHEMPAARGAFVDDALAAERDEYHHKPQPRVVGAELGHAAAGAASRRAFFEIALAVVARSDAVVGDRHAF